MLIFAHLCIGAVIGLHLSRVTKNPSLVLFSILGSLLPDLVDKPSEVLGLGDILGYEALFLHTLLALAILAVAGILALHLFRSPVPAIVAGMVGTHQVLDLMWLTPEEWLYPFLGPIPQSCSCLTPSLSPIPGTLALDVPIDFVWRQIAVEIFSPSEWVFFVVLALILLAPRLDRRALLWGSGLLAVLSLAALVPFAGLPVHLIAEGGMEMEVLLVLVSCAGAAGLWLYDRKDRMGHE
jgi:hypothetical protein